MKSGFVYIGNPEFPLNLLNSRLLGIGSGFLPKPEVLGSWFSTTIKNSSNSALSYRPDFTISMYAVHGILYFLFLILPSSLSLSISFIASLLPAVSICYSARILSIFLYSFFLYSKRKLSF